MRRIGDVPAVTQHRDLTPENILVTDSGFTAVDWESATSDGFPLGDLLYFLAGALARLDGHTEADVDYLSRLFRGELESSDVMFRWVTTAVDALGIPPGSVGPLATLAWIGIGMSIRAREGSAGRADAPGHPFAAAWLSDPALGPGWRGRR
jgi:hypothetical protein